MSRSISKCVSVWVFNQGLLAQHLSSSEEGGSREYLHESGGRATRYSNEKRWGVGSKVQGYSGPGRVTQK